MQKIYLLFFICITLNFSIYAQPYKQKNSSEILASIKKLNVLGSVLFVAAHPDDENTALLSFLANDKLLKTAYLSVTRGDGGQNLIGNEKYEQLGIIRTQELLEARKVDGAEQYFTSAIDFGYSKTAEETIEIWNKEKIIGDIVWLIRKLKPDVIITRFSESVGGHGHHLASAILSYEAFKVAGNPEYYPEQLKYVEPFQPKRIVWNAWQPQLQNRDENLPPLVSFDIGKFNTLLGKSYNEISAESRSKHKSQGFGAASNRGSMLNYFEHKFGEEAEYELFDNIDLSWKRINGGNEIEKLITKIYNEFNHDNPSASINDLIILLKQIKSLPDSYWKNIKQKEVEELIRQCSGLWIEAISKDYIVLPGNSLYLSLRTINRSSENFILNKILFPFSNEEINISKTTEFNKPFSIDTLIKIPENQSFSIPYWLEEKGLNGSFNIKNLELTGLPQSPNEIVFQFVFNIKDEEIIYNVPAFYRWVDRVDGELYRNIEIAPPVTIYINEENILFYNAQSKELNIKLVNNDNYSKGILKLKTNNNWKIEPSEIQFELTERFEEKNFVFKVIPPKEFTKDELQVSVEVNNKIYNRTKVSINYPHIQIQNYYPELKPNLINLDTKNSSLKIGYIMGSGDNIPLILNQLGYNVTLIEPEVFNSIDLSQFKSIIAGIRAYNTRKELRIHQDKLLEYVFNGGNLIIQYTVAGSFANDPIVTEKFSPFNLKISRERVSDENSIVNILLPEHLIFNYPNKITEKDFENWVQERGLYFASEWGEEFKPLIGLADPNESELKGGLLLAKYGKGNYVYTGISFFRQLPAGVEGAIRLFINLIELENGN